MLVRLWRKLRGGGEASEHLSDEEYRAREVEREHRKRGRRRGESYVRTYGEPATNYRPGPPPLPPDEE